MYPVCVSVLYSYELVLKRAEYFLKSTLLHYG